ncbi:sister chromatid cohesion protein PDS5 homolog C-like [Lotus japonicus]|uniref:sister chromatid cohesion protein PDS5 homolog C-like n=1 Tax=Lotus japonicus TaxID=34305 RepID=UPI00258B5954|nr:sister chromatid cohesion protein PDS5 homolog C-like [Lotus japonicus]
MDADTAAHPMESSEKELEERLLKAGNELADPPSSAEELLSILERVESYLSKIEQTPNESMQTALSPTLKALTGEIFLKHSDADVKVAVASCLSEITRITAPDAPYDDDEMKEVFQLIVSSFENLHDKSSRSYAKKLSMLETVAKVRSCVVMLDLECDHLILEMFQHFLKEIREHHPEDVFSSMETVMTLVLEESEDISMDLLCPLLATFKKDNEEVSPIALQLVERVLENCATKLQPYLVQAVKTLGISVDDSKILAKICQDASDSFEKNDVCVSSEHVEDKGKSPKQSSEETTQAAKGDATEAEHSQQDNPNGNRSPKSVMSNGVACVREDNALADSKSNKQEDTDCSGHSESLDVSGQRELNNLDAEKVDNDGGKPKQTTKRRRRKSRSSTKSRKPSVKAGSQGQVVAHEKEAEKPSVVAGSQDQVDADEKEAEKRLDSEAPSSPHEDHSVEAAGPTEEDEETHANISSPEACNDDSEVKGSPSTSENLPNKNHSKKLGKAKMKEDPAKEGAAEDVSNKMSKGASDSEAKPARHSVKKALGRNSDVKDTTVAHEKEAEKRLDSEAPSSPHEGHSVEAAGPTEDDKETHADISSPEACDDESEVKASPSTSENLHDQIRSKKLGKAKIKDIPAKEGATEDVSIKVSRGASNSEAKPARRSVKKALGRNSDVKDTTVADLVKKGSGAASDVDAKKNSAKKLGEHKSDINAKKHSAKKLDEQKGGSGSSSRKLENNKKSGRGKANSEAAVAKSSAIDVDKEMTVYSPRSGTKSTKSENTEEIPLTSAKRKRTPGKEKESDTKKYGENLVGLRVKVWWPEDREFYTGVVNSFDSARKKHKVLYDDGDEETLNLREEKWGVIKKADSDADGEEGSDQAGLDGSAEMPPTKKGKSSSQSTKQGKTGASSSFGATGSGGSKGISLKSGHKSKDGNKSKDSKDTTPRSGGSKYTPEQKMTSKSKTTPKPSAKSKQETMKSGKSKQKTPKTAASKRKQPPKSNGKSNVNDSDKVKSALKRKDSEDESSDVSSREVEDTKAELSEDDDISTPTPSAKSKKETLKSGKSKQTTQKTASSKRKLPKSSGKSDVKDSDKLMSILLKRKDPENESSDVSSREVEDTKGKLSISSKAQGSGAKREKKRQRS